MKTFLSLCAIVLIWANTALAAIVGEAVEVSVITENGWSIPFYTVKSSHDLKKVYAEAVRGDHYRIVVRNNLNRRVGVVVAVDGRNIISGQKSWLRNTERMYILDPYATNEYSGWRAGQDRVNRFYFTAVPDSYAAAFGDQSAMGVIALAVAGLVPFVTAIATLFGFGALLLAAWRMLRHEGSPLGATDSVLPVPSRYCRASREALTSTTATNVLRNTRIFGNRIGR
jgi:hypothetical protein